MRGCLVIIAESVDQNLPQTVSLRITRSPSGPSTGPARAELPTFVALIGVPGVVAAADVASSRQPSLGGQRGAVGSESSVSIM